MKKERMYKLFVYTVSILHILFGILVFIISINTPEAGVLRLLSLYTILFGITLIILFVVSTQYHEILQNLKNATEETVGFLLDELKEKK